MCCFAVVTALALHLETPRHQTRIYDEKKKKKESGECGLVSRTRPCIAPKHLIVKLGARLAKNVALDVFITEHAVRVDGLQYANKVVETGI